MKGTIVIAAALAVGACNPPKSTGIFEPAQAEVLIRDLEREWAEVRVTADAAAAERLLADDFLGIRPDGTSYTKQALLDELRTNPAPLSSNEVDELRVRFFGHTAIVQGHESFIEKSGEKGRYATTDVLVRGKDGTWRIVSAHDAVASTDERPKSP